MANNSIGWGKCSVLVADIDADTVTWTKLPTPKEDTAVLTPTKGDKHEATIEGGDNEDVKYDSNTYELAYAFRRNVVRTKPFSDVNGVISNHYAVFVQPENPNVPGPLIQDSVVSLEESFDTEDGGLLTYTHDAMTPTDGKKVAWVTCSTEFLNEEEGSTYSGLTFTDKDDSTEYSI